MALIVQKFGGSSVRDAARIQNVAGIIADTYRAGNQVLVVLSAQGDTTDDLITKANEINPDASKREMDVLLSSGEQISIALLAMAIEKIGCPVVSLTGWQAGFNTNAASGNARINNIDTERMQSELDRRNIIVVAGFQGLDKYDNITTLGRGGSDTSAVAIAAAMQINVRFILMSTGSILPIRVSARTQKSWMKSHTTRCLNLQASVRMCFITEALRWRRSIM